jgi:hypothetical protein
MGDGSWSATGCEPVGTVQGTEAASQGDARDGCGWVNSVRYSVGCRHGDTFDPPSGPKAF